MIPICKLSDQKHMSKANIILKCHINKKKIVFLLTTCSFTSQHFLVHCQRQKCVVNCLVSLLLILNVIANFTQCFGVFVVDWKHVNSVQVTKNITFPCTFLNCFLQILKLTFLQTNSFSREYIRS